MTMASKVFEWFESKPMASGSIAQVHKAILNGDMVAVKVRSPFFFVLCLLGTFCLLSFFCAR